MSARAEPPVFCYFYTHQLDHKRLRIMSETDSRREWTARFTCTKAHQRTQHSPPLARTDTFLPELQLCVRVVPGGFSYEVTP